MLPVRVRRIYDAVVPFRMNRTRDVSANLIGVFASQEKHVDCHIKAVEFRSILFPQQYR